MTNYAITVILILSDPERITALPAQLQCCLMSVFYTCGVALWSLTDEIHLPSMKDSLAEVSSASVCFFHVKQVSLPVL